MTTEVMFMVQIAIIITMSHKLRLLGKVLKSAATMHVRVAVLKSTRNVAVINRSSNGYVLGISVNGD
jgi:hypothetical protein